MSMPKGTKLPRGIGKIRVLCKGHKMTTEAQNKINNSKRTFYPIESSSRMNCCYCDRAAEFISIPENVIVTEAESCYA